MNMLVSSNAPVLPLRFDTTPRASEALDVLSPISAERASEAILSYGDNHRQKGNAILRQDAASVVALRAPRGEMTPRDVLASLPDADPGDIADNMSRGDKVFLIFVQASSMDMKARNGERDMSDKAMDLSVALSRSVQQGIKDAAVTKFAAAFATTAVMTGVQAYGMKTSFKGHGQMGKSARLNEMPAAKTNRNQTRLADNLKKNEKLSPHLVREQPLAQGGSGTKGTAPADGTNMPSSHQAVLEKPAQDMAFETNHRTASGHLSNAVGSQNVVMGQMIMSGGTQGAAMSNEVAGMASAPIEAEIENNRMLFTHTEEMKRKFDDSARDAAARVVASQDLLKNILNGMNDGNKTIVSGI